MLTDHRSKIDALMRHFHKAGLALETVCDKRHLARASSTVKKYARELALAFPDYVPMSLREKKVRA